MRLLLVAVLGVVGLPVLAAGANTAAATQYSQCSDSVNFFTALTNPDLRLRKHNEPETGLDSWTGDDGIGWGWDSRFISGPNGYVYIIGDNGVLQRQQWTASGWANNGVSKTIDTGWTGWNALPYRFRVTVDSNNDLYSVGNTGELRRQVYDDATNTWTRTTIDTGWGKYDQVFAAGDGVLYARDPAVAGGTLYRFKYDRLTGTWTQKDKHAGTGWNGYKQLVSPGADIIYGLVEGGDVWWYRYLPADDKWANSTNGNYKERVAHWTGVDEIAPAIDACKLAEAATEIQCAPSVNMFARLPNREFWLRPHSEPETGLSNMDAGQAIGFGWDARFVSAPNGYKYLFEPNGDVNRHRWTASGWADNGISEKVGTGQTAWGDPATRYKIAIDTNSHFYIVLPSGELQRSEYNETAKTWSHEIIDTGWAKYDQLFAAGDGVLYARDPALNSGNLFRFQYDTDTRRWVEYATDQGWGWNGYKHLVSPGADIVYGLDWDGNVWWYRYNPATKVWVDSVRGNFKEVVARWGASEITADIDACKLVSPVTVTPPVVAAPNNERAQLLFNPGSQKLELVYVSNDGILRRGYQSSPGTEVVEWQALPGHQSFTGRASTALRQDGKLVTVAHSRADAGVRSFTQAASGGTSWSNLVNLKGALAASPILVKGAGDLLTAFSVDSAGKLWYSKQSKVDGELQSWRPATNTGDYTMSTDFSVVRNGDAFEIVYRDAANTVTAKKFQNGGLQPARAAGGLSTGGIPAAAVFGDGKIQLVARGADNKLYTQKETATGFTGWTDISDGLTFKGSPAVLLNAHGIVEIAVRRSDDTVYRGGQTAPGATTWRDWETNLDTSVVDPAFAAAAGSEQRIFYLDGGANYYLLNATAYTSSPGAAMAESDGKQVRTVDPIVTEGKIG